MKPLDSSHSHSVNTLTHHNNSNDISGSEESTSLFQTLTKQRTREVKTQDVAYISKIEGLVKTKHNDHKIGHNSKIRNYRLRYAYFLSLTKSETQ